MKKRLLPLSLTAAILAVALPAHASPKNWVGNDDGNWTDAARWDPSGTPGTGNIVTIGDVTADGSSGTPVRTVTLNTGQAGGSNPIVSLILTQTTEGFINRLLFSGTAADLRVTGLDAVNLSTGTILELASTDARGIRLRDTSSSAVNPYTITSAGTIILANRGAIYTQANDAEFVTIASSGNMQFNPSIGSGDQVLIGTIVGNLNARYTLNNTGTMEFVRGLSVFGTLATGTNHQLFHWNNNADGVVNLATGSTDATVLMQSRSSGSVAGETLFTTAAGSVTTIGGNDANGTLRFSHLGTGTGGTGVNPAVSNAGVLNINGASLIELDAAATRYSAFNFTNTATGEVNITGNAIIGNTTKATLFSNEGVLNKTGAGTASILSSGDGEALNSGTILVGDENGTLFFSRPLTSTGSLIGNGTISVDNGGITIGNGGIVRAGLSEGDIATTFTLAAAANEAIIFGEGSTLVVDLGLETGVSDHLFFDGDILLTANNTLSIVQSAFTPGVFTVASWSGDRIVAGEFSTILYNGAAANPSLIQVDYLDMNGTLQVTVIPEPKAALIAGVACLLLLIGRRRLAKLSVAA